MIYIVPGLIKIKCEQRSCYITSILLYLVNNEFFISSWRENILVLTYSILEKYKYLSVSYSHKLKTMDFYLLIYYLIYCLNIPLN